MLTLNEMLYFIAGVAADIYFAKQIVLLVHHCVFEHHSLEVIISNVLVC